MNVLSWITSSLLPELMLVVAIINFAGVRGWSALTLLAIPTFTSLSPRKKALDICRVKASITMVEMTNRIVAANWNLPWIRPDYAERASWCFCDSPLREIQFSRVCYNDATTGSHLDSTIVILALPLQITRVFFLGDRLVNVENASKVRVTGGRSASLLALHVNGCGYRP